LVGNWTVTLSINFSGGQLILSAISLWNEDFVANSWQTVITSAQRSFETSAEPSLQVLMFWAVMLVCFLVNAFGSRYLDLINKICIWWTSASVLIILVTLLSMAERRRSGKFVFSDYDASSSGWPSGWAFFVGLLSPAYTLTGVCLPLISFREDHCWSLLAAANGQTDVAVEENSNEVQVMSNFRIFTLTNCNLSTVW
jgi:amino acid transporter